MTNTDRLLTVEELLATPAMQQTMAQESRIERRVESDAELLAALAKGTAAGEFVTFQAWEPVIAWGRPESEPCESGTPGCAVDHARSTRDECATW